MKVSLRIVGLIILGICIFLFWSTSNNSLASTIDEKADEVQLNGTVLVAKGGAVLFQKAYGFENKEYNLLNTIETAFPIGSITKSFTATSILQLEETGQLSTNQYISDFIEDFPHGNDIIIHHLLTHSSGIPEFLKVVKNEQAYEPIQIITEMKKEELMQLPGEGFSYSNTNYLILANIIEKVTGQPYQNYIKEHIFEKADMKSSGFLDDGLTEYAEGYENMKKPSRTIDDSLKFGAGDIVSTAGDMLKYHRAIQDGTLLSEKATVKMQTGYVDSAPLGIVKYGYGWQVFDNKISFDKKMVMHSGGLPGHKAEFTRYIDDDVTIIILTNNQDKTKLRAISAEIAAFLFGKRFYNWQKFI
ncbi:serine hydrolase domain-containing protein [Mesobacillus subterraneus]|uniref:serine hydrolase domain-containing protein n=1 Tax=Mesobacillus subterraneus TaxID=285983 RepID=UPI001CFC63FC|nr:serine hydrolase domain-containing protein [Mesobacillus subterraneus]WLR54503.1 serine hydrolase domain-containing protein [Mesobacillus subterraneus]